MTEEVTAEDVLERVAALPRGRRHVIGIAGAPGSGKSTAAEAMVAALNAAAPGRAAILPMDGYHYDDALLDARGLLPRKGAPETFDVGGFLHMAARLRANEEAEVAVPVFDRAIEIARAGARMIPREVELLLVEGNYLLLDRAPWDGLAELFDLTVFIDVPEAELARRLAQRWEGHGLDPATVRAKLEENDLPNGRLVRDLSRPADLVLRAR